MNQSKDIREFVFEYAGSTLKALGYRNADELRKMNSLYFEKYYNMAWESYLAKMHV